MRLFVALMAACFILSMSGMGYNIKLTPENTSVNIGFRTFAMDIPFASHQVITNHAAGIIVIDGAGYARDIPSKEVVGFRLLPGEKRYDYYQESVIFLSANRSMAGAVDLIYFKGEMPAFDQQNKLLERAYGINAERLNATAESSEGMETLFHGYTGVLYAVNNPLNNKDGKLVQIMPDGHTVMNFLLDLGSYEKGNTTLKYWGANT